MRIVLRKASMRGLLLFVVIGIISSSLSAQVPTPEEFYRDPVSGFEKALDTFRDPQLDRATCVTQLHALRALIGSVDGTKLKVPSLGASQTGDFEALQDLLNGGSRELQALRFLLIQLMHEYHNAHPLTRQEADEFKAGIRVLRTLDERMAYYVRWVLEGGQNQAGRSWWGNWKSRNDRLPSTPQYIVNLNPRAGRDSPLVPMESLDLDSVVEDGDIVLTLGDGASEVSQLIMNIASGVASDSDFSHVFTVREVDGRITKIEALIEDGTHFRSWDEFKKKRYARFVIMRFRDPEVAARGQAETEKRIRDIKEVLGKNVIYNARMQALSQILNENSGLPMRLNCLQTAECIWIFGHEGKPPHSFPQFPTIVSHRDPYVLDQMTIPNNTEMPHPGDLNSDPVLVPVLEYRDPLLTHQAFLGRVILTFILKKITEEGYRLRPNWVSNFASSVLWPIRRYTPEWLLTKIPLLRKLAKSFDQDMDRQLLAFSLTLKNVVMRMFPEVLARDQKFVASNQSQIPSNFEQAMAIVEAVYLANTNAVQRYLYSPERERQEAHERLKRDRQKGQGPSDGFGFGFQPLF